MAAFSCSLGRSIVSPCQGTFDMPLAITDNESGHISFILEQMKIDGPAPSKLLMYLDLNSPKLLENVGDRMGDLDPAIMKCSLFDQFPPAFGIPDPLPSGEVSLLAALASSEDEDESSESSFDDADLRI